MKSIPRQLATQDIDALQAAILELNSHRDLNDFRAALPGIMLKLIPANYFNWNELLVDMKASTWHPVDFVEFPPGFYVPFVKRFLPYGAQHPFSKPFMENPNATALKFSDFYTLQKLRQAEFFKAGYALDKLIRLMSIPIWLHPGLVSSLNFAGRGQDFSERDRQMLNRIAPHFKLAYQNAELATAQATALSKSLIAYQLTPRESEIAIWLAEGKANPEIAAILGPSPRTIEKHVERILAKLGVENRTTAAVIIANGQGKRPTV